jgi:GrpB-like predicted nucleotidyltransferase (UPF0157 family)
VKIEITPYNPDWKKIFDEEKIILSELLKDYNPVIEHIGSTAVEGLGAKPVVDIQIGVHQYEHLDLFADKMIRSGYIYYKKYEDVLPDRRYFVRASNPNNDALPEILLTYADKFDREKYPHLIHIHTVELNSHWWRRHIAFRDYLRANNNARDEYYNLKIDLAKREWEDKNDYTDAKTDFIKRIEKLAGHA